jgi:hypothetical protein
MKTLHYYMVAFAVTAVFFGLIVLVSGKQNMSAQANSPGYSPTPMHNANDQSDPAARALANQRTQHQDANLAHATPAPAAGEASQPE